MCHDKPFYQAGYFLIKLRPITFGSQASKSVYTCSTCINDSLLDSWSYTWTTKNNDGIDEIKASLELNDSKIELIRDWADREFAVKRIGWPNVFKDIETAQEYRNTFLPHLSDTHIIGVYFSEPEIADLLSEFDPMREGLGFIGLHWNLQQMLPEDLSTRETFIGFDIIGIENGGDFHTFYCHDMSNDLVEKFHLTLNRYGLFDDSPDWHSVTDYMNAEETGCEPVPWYVCKVKLVNERTEG